MTSYLEWYQMALAIAYLAKVVDDMADLEYQFLWHTYITLKSDYNIDPANIFLWF